MRSVLYISVIGFGMCISIATRAQDVINACVESSGRLRIVAELSFCRGSDTPLSWNQVGPQGVPGPQGDPGPQGPPGAPAGSGLREFVGLTAATTPGNIGLFGFAQMCDAEFPGSGQCTSGEIIEAAAETKDLSGFARIRPEFIATGSGFIDGPSGVQDTVNGLTCRNWAATSGTGIVAVFNDVPPGFGIVPHRGILRSELCGDSLPVACCRAGAAVAD